MESDQRMAPGDLYELSAKLGELLRRSGLGDKHWQISTAGQLNLLVNAARTLGLDKAVNVLTPLVDACTADDGCFVPDGDMA